MREIEFLSLRVKDLLRRVGFGEDFERCSI